MHYFIDGYNLLFRILGNPRPLQRSRQHVIASINEKVSLLKLNATLVFDGASEEHAQNSRGHFDVLEIIYTSKAQSADDYILEEIQQSSTPSQETIVTSDRELALRCKNLGAKIKSIESFLEWIEKKCKKDKAAKRPSPKKGFKESDFHFTRLLKIFEKRLLEEAKEKKRTR